VTAESRRPALGLAGLIGLAAAAVPLAAPGTGLVPGAVEGGPGWLRGLYGDGLGLSGGAYYGFLWLGFVSYLCLLAGARSLAPRLLWGAIGLGVLAFALAPPLLSQDVFSYISYARLDTEHGLNPYVDVPADAPADPAFAHVGWRDAVSAYGPLFTVGTLPLGWLGVPVALWVLKALAAASVFGLAALCARLAPARGIDPRSAAAFVALNPLVLVHVVGGAHNDALMMLLVMLGAAGVLALAEGSAGAALAAGVAIKVSAAFAAPFALLGAERRPRLIAGLVVAAAVCAAASLVAFGPHALDAVGLVGENQAATSHYSVPATLSRLIGADVDAVRTVALALYAASVLYLLRWTWRGGDWLRSAGWAAFGLLVASGWLLPWYLIWALPLAALARDRALALALLALTAFQLVNRIPL
jgi:alpha-1,6-mannosyltransferase